MQDTRHLSEFYQFSFDKSEKNHFDWYNQQTFDRHFYCIVQKDHQKQNFKK